MVAKRGRPDICGVTKIEAAKNSETSDLIFREMLDMTEMTHMAEMTDMTDMADMTGTDLPSECLLRKLRTHCFNFCEGDYGFCFSTIIGPTLHPVQSDVGGRVASV